MLSWIRSIQSAKQTPDDNVPKFDQTQTKPKANSTFFKKLRKCFSETEESSLIAGMSAACMGPNKLAATGAPNTISKHDDPQNIRIREWVMESSRYLSPPTTPHRDGSHKDEVTCETERSKATTSSLPGKEIEHEATRPRLAKEMTISGRHPRNKILGEEVQFSRRTRTTTTTSLPQTVAHTHGIETRSSISSPKSKSDHPPAVFAHAVSAPGSEPVIAACDGGGSGQGEGERLEQSASWAGPLGLLFAPILCTQNRRIP